jgi:predicted RND superfamily exporter protein
MIPQAWIDAYLRFLLKYSGTVAVIVTVVTLYFMAAVTGMRLHTEFFDFYPKFRTTYNAFKDCRADTDANFFSCLGNAIVNPGPDPYIQIYNDFREMFGSANMMSVILEVKEGDIYNPETLQKLDRITKHITNAKGVVPYQIASIAHPKVRSITTRAGALEIRELFYPAVPQTQADAERVRFGVYSTKGVRGLYTAMDDTAAVVHAGFWEEELDFNFLYDHMMEMKNTEQDAKHNIYITGFPWLYTSVLRYTTQVLLVFLATIVSLSFLLYVYFRTWTGVWVPIFSGLISSVWGLGIAVLLGFNLDPLVLVIPVFLTARALSHSVQSMDRYHEEYYRTGDKNQAIVESYGHLFPPAIASIITDGIGLLVVAVAPIPLIQKVAIFASFWVVSIFVSVVTLHPIILKWIDPPPKEHADIQVGPIPMLRGAMFVGINVLIVLALNLMGVTYPVPDVMGGTGDFGGGWFLFWCLPAVCWFWYYYAEKIYPAITWVVIQGSEGWRRWAMVGLTVVLFIGGASQARHLKVGDMSPGMALLFPDHPYNIGWDKLNDKFLGASQLIVIADTKRPDGIKDSKPLQTIEEFTNYMIGAEGASDAVTIIDIVKRLARLYHDGDPRWGLIPDNPKEIGQLFYVFTNSSAPGDLNRFMDPSGRYATVLTLFRGYSHKIITESIEYGKEFAKMNPSDDVEFKFAGGLFGILAAVNDAVESSYWTNIALIWLIVYICLYLTYGTIVGCLILMIPVVLSQIVAEALMVLMKIDLNVNSLPIAAAGAGVGVDYGIYHFSRMIDSYDEIGDLDEAVDHATATTGKAIIFTATTMIAGTIFWWFSALKFQAEMGFLLALLMSFNTFGGLVLVPAWVKVIRPKFFVNRIPKRLGQHGGTPTPAASS